MPLPPTPVPPLPCEEEPEAFYVAGVAQHQAAARCRPCPQWAECLAEALDERIQFGVWGGMTERQRRALLRNHPDVSSWRDVLTQACQDNPGLRAPGERSRA